MWGVYPKSINLNIALHTKLLVWASISVVWSQKHFKKWAQFYRFLGSESVVLESHFRYIHPKLNLSVYRYIPVYCPWINTLYAYVWSFEKIWKKKCVKIVVTLKPIMQFWCPSRLRILKMIFTHSVLWKKTKKTLPVRRNPPIQQNRRISWTNNAILIFCEI